jgi:imidazoleglycerol-phosphate dehydratase/histidinol-phosphatase
LDYELVMVTNQDGLGTDSFPEDTFWTQNFILRAFENEGVYRRYFVDRSFPEDNAPTRKPRTGMLTKYIDNPEYDLANSLC